MFTGGDIGILRLGKRGGVSAGTRNGYLSMQTVAAPGVVGTYGYPANANNANQQHRMWGMMGHVRRDLTNSRGDTFVSAAGNSALQVCVGAAPTARPVMTPHVYNQCTPPMPRHPMYGNGMGHRHHGARTLRAVCPLSPLGRKRIVPPALPCRAALPPSLPPFVRSREVRLALARGRSSTIASKSLPWLSQAGHANLSLRNSPEI